MTAISSPNYRWRVGEIEITRVLEFEAALFEPAVIHPEASPEIIARHRTWLEPTLMDPASGLLVFAFHSTVIRTPRATILVDTCSGNDKERPHKLRYHRKNWPYLAISTTAGFMPEDIDYVLCTHLHADHVGWNTRVCGGSRPTFPERPLPVARREWEHWREAELRAASPPIHTIRTPATGHGQWPGRTRRHGLRLRRKCMDRAVAGAYTRPRLRHGALAASIRGPEWRHHAHGAAMRRAAAQQLLLR